MTRVLLALVGGLGLALPVIAGDVTESPFPIDPRSWYVETDLFRRTSDTADGTHFATHVYGATLIGYGLNPATEVQLTVEPWVRFEEKSGGMRSHVAGVGDLSLRVNRSLRRDSEDVFGVSVMPYLTLPTAARAIGTGRMTGGIIVPVAHALSDSCTLGAMAAVALERDAANTRHELHASAGACVDFRLTGRWGGYVEVFGATSGRSWARWDATAGAGVTCAVHPQVDVMLGGSAGVTRDAADQDLFLRVSTFW